MAFILIFLKPFNLLWASLPLKIRNFRFSKFLFNFVLVLRTPATERQRVPFSYLVRMCFERQSAKSFLDRFSIRIRSSLTLDLKDRAEFIESLILQKRHRDPKKNVTDFSTQNDLITFCFFDGEITEFKCLFYFTADYSMEFEVA